MKNNIVFCIGLVLFFVALSFFILHPQGVHNVFETLGNFSKNIAAVFFRESITATQLREKYSLANRENTKLRILVVPGHEPNYGGAEYKNLKERDLNVELAGYLEGFLKENYRYDVVLSRDGNNWNPKLAQYFDENSGRIEAFKNENQDNMLYLINNGSLVKIDNNIKHNSAPQEVALRLFGINMWANENNISIIVHIHFNDYPRKNVSIPGQYSGFSIYVPEKQYSNSTTTRIIAGTVYKRLAKYSPVSNMPKEDIGVVEEQDLIAIGSYNTLDAPSLLIEYDYIYESQFADPKTRGPVLKDLAFQTYLGIQDFFGNQNSVYKYDTLVLPHLWDSSLTEETAEKGDILALQTALIIDGAYPPKGRSKNDCPRTGNFGDCTLEALEIFQNKYKISGEEDVVGKKTREILNGLYSI